MNTASMSDKEQLWEAQRVIGKHWKSSAPSQQADILGLARDVLQFISATGQRHDFGDYRKALVGAPARESEAPAHSEARLERTQQFFRHLLSGGAGEDAACIHVILDALHFVAATGQWERLLKFIEHLDAGAPPYPIAAFESLQAAEAWLRNHPSPPDFAHIIVGREYRSVFHDRETGRRNLPNDNAIEYYLAELREEEPPVAVATFTSEEQAKEWMRTQSPPVRQAWVSIRGDMYLAAYYAHLDHTALFPLAMADGYEI